MTQPYPPPGPIPYAGYSPDASAFDRDADHLKILAILHFVWGGLTLLFSSFFVVYVVLGLVMASGNLNGSAPTPAYTLTALTTGPAAPAVLTPTYAPPPQPPPWTGYLVAVIGGGLLILGWTLGGLTIASGVKLGRRRSRTFSLVRRRPELRLGPDRHDARRVHVRRSAPRDRQGGLRAANGRVIGSST